LILDENVLNSILFSFNKVEKQFSLRRMMTANSRMALFKQLLTTTSMAMLLPSFNEEYTGREMIDLTGTMCEKVVIKEFPDTKPSSITMNEDGTMKFNLNVAS
jgi:hypothetical protein